MDGSQTSEEKQEIELRGTCPYCLSTIDVYLDKKHRPYWTCLPCGTRTFATKIAMDSLRGFGWIWTKERPVVALRKWLKQVAKAMSLEQRGKADG